MKKFASALAVAAVVAAPSLAQAQAPAPQVYGFIGTSVEHHDNGDDSGQNVVSRASHIGLRGGLPTGVGNMLAIYQLQSTIHSDTGGGTLLGQDSWVGLRGGFGMLRAGHIVPPSTVLAFRAGFFRNQIGDARDGFGHQVAFDGRWHNALAYAIEFGDVGVDLYYSTGHGPTSPSTETNDGVIGLGVTYANGPLWAGLTYEHHDEDFIMVAPDTVVYGDQDSVRLAAGYTAGALKVAGLFEMANWEPRARALAAAPLAGVDDTSTTIGGGASYNIDRLTLKGQVYHTMWDDRDDVDHTLVALGVDYALGDTTTAYVALAMTMNDDGASSVPWNGGLTDGYGSQLDGVAGEDAMGLGVGLRHRF